MHPKIARVDASRPHFSTSLSWPCLIILYRFFTRFFWFILFEILTLKKKRHKTHIVYNYNKDIVGKLLNESCQFRRLVIVQETFNSLKFYSSHMKGVSQQFKFGNHPKIFLALSMSCKSEINYLKLLIIIYII